MENNRAEEIKAVRGEIRCRPFFAKFAHINWTWEQMSLNHCPRDTNSQPIYWFIRRSIEKIDSTLPSLCRWVFNWVWLKALISACFWFQKGRHLDKTRSNLFLARLWYQNCGQWSNRSVCICISPGVFAAMVGLLKLTESKSFHNEIRNGLWPDECNQMSHSFCSARRRERRR